MREVRYCEAAHFQFLYTNNRCTSPYFRQSTAKNGNAVTSEAVNKAYTPAAAPRCGPTRCSDLMVRNFCGTMIMAYAEISSKYISSACRIESGCQQRAYARDKMRTTTGW